MGYATLSRSRTYIMVPRDVPPENFVTVQETRKVERVGLARCLLPPCLVVGCLLLLASILAAVGFLLSIKTYEANTETGKTLWSNRQQGDEAIYCGEGEWGSLKCHPCLCSKIGSLSKACHRGSGQCTCKEGHSGHKCDICPQVNICQKKPSILIYSRPERLFKLTACRQMFSPVGKKLRREHTELSIQQQPACSKLNYSSKLNYNVNQWTC